MTALQSYLLRIKLSILDQREIHFLTPFRYNSSFGSHFRIFLEKPAQFLAFFPLDPRLLPQARQNYLTNPELRSLPPNVVPIGSIVDV